MNKRTTFISRDKVLGVLAAMLIAAGTAWLYGAGPLAAPAASSQEAAASGYEKAADASLVAPEPGSANPQTPAAAASPQPSGSEGAGPEAGAAPAGQDGAAAKQPPPQEGVAGAASPAPGKPGAAGQAAGVGAAAGAASPGQSASAGPKPPSSAASPSSGSKPPSSAASPSAGSKPPSSAASPSAGSKPSPSVSPSASPQAKPGPGNTVAFSVTGSAATGTIVKATRVEISDGETVLDLLKQATRSIGMQVEFSGKGATAYVSGIDNLYEFDDGAGSGWLFSVNGKFSSRSAGSVQLEPGDEVRWVYTTDYGKDVGASGDDGAGSGSGSDG